MSFYGHGLGPAEGAGAEIGADGRVGTSLAGVQVLFDGTPAPLLYVQDRQINAVAPFAVGDEQRVSMEIEYEGRRSQRQALVVGAAAPAIFTIHGSGNGYGAILNQDGAANSPANPAARGSVATLYATGTGPLTPQPDDGQVIENSPYPRLVQPLAVYFSDPGQGGVGIAGEVLYAGAAPGFVAGALQFNARVPENADTGPDRFVWVQLRPANPSEWVYSLPVRIAIE